MHAAGGAPVIGRRLTGKGHWQQPLHEYEKRSVKKRRGLKNRSYWIFALSRAVWMAFNSAAEV
ncbi:hypothetical protein F220043C3_11940 [Enterocloster asparagiformis]